ncbi:Manganese/iron superoxide dismutase [Halenospora varia]|nr:Manganese/iron superoxide dismutase [Halenospora varia]
MLRPTLPRIGHSLRVFRRSLHNVPTLQHSYKQGVPGLLSPLGFDIAWTKYQKLLVDKLNQITAGTVDDSSAPKELVLKFARDPNHAPVFNNASMAFNNDFFFRGLTPEPKPMPELLKQDLEASFSSIETLQREFVLTANAMFGPGFVWLMKTNQNKYFLLTTYIAGTPLPKAHYRRQTKDMNTATPADDDKSISDHIRRLNAEPPVNSAGAHSGGVNKTELAPGGIEAEPVLCINTWEHVYLADYGVAGKKQYAESWWNAIDWDQVSKVGGGFRMQPAYYRG